MLLIIWIGRSWLAGPSRFGIKEHSNIMYLFYFLSHLMTDCSFGTSVRHQCTSIRHFYIPLSSSSSWHIRRPQYRGYIIRNLSKYFGVAPTITLNSPAHPLLFSYRAGFIHVLIFFLPDSISCFRNLALFRKLTQKNVFTRHVGLFLGHRQVFRPWLLRVLQALVQLRIAGGNLHLDSLHVCREIPRQRCGAVLLQFANQDLVWSSRLDSTIR